MCSSDLEYILNHSTLGWWGSYLSQNYPAKTYYPKDVFRIYLGSLNSSAIQYKERMEDHYLPDWECIDYPAF